MRSGRCFSVLRVFGAKTLPQKLPGYETTQVINTTPATVAPLQVASVTFAAGLACPEVLVVHVVDGDHERLELARVHLLHLEKHGERVSVTRAP